MTIGQVTHVPAVVGDRVVARPACMLRFTFDERVEDGLYCAKTLSMLKERIEDPAGWLTRDLGRRSDDVLLAE
jgi:pyruvate/2-oxoglutarate dehydrogenase complex dihydrolipoamide acyltransferase (E2) component